MTVALIAHDSKKALMENLCVAYRYILSKHKLCATGTTGRHIEESSGLSVRKYIAGQLGGTRQLCAQILADEIDLVVFLVDPHRRPQEPPIHNVLNLCEERNVPLATNLATAEVLLAALERGDLRRGNVSG